MSLSRPELEELHYKILNYISQNGRIMSCYKTSTWNDFITNNFQYSDYSSENIRNEFVQTILPKVFTYNLSDFQKRVIEIFTNHYCFTKTAEGFSEIPHSSDRIPVEGVHFVRTLDDPRSSTIACVFVPHVSQTPYPDIKLTALASAMNSSDAELVCRRLHRGKQLHSRVKLTKEIFHRTHQLPKNMNRSIAKKIVNFREKDEKLSSLVSKVLYNEEKSSNI